VLTHAGLQRARALVVAGPDEDASALVVTAARDLAPELPIIARAITVEGTKRLAQLGAQDVIHPELEGGLEIVRHTLLQLGFPLQEIYRYTDAVRRDHYDLQSTPRKSIACCTIFWMPPAASRSGGSASPRAILLLDGRWPVRICAHGPALQLWQSCARAIDGQPKIHDCVSAGDRVGLIGNQEEIDAAEQLLLVQSA
jgi:monovalent cation:H+ antiporter-2, CPA2 family